MDVEKSTLSELGAQPGGAPQQGDVLLACCAKTLAIHASHNPMMVCPECKQIVKCFNDDKAYRNYLRFCESRHRKVFTAKHHGMFVVVFRSYDTYNT